MYRKGVIVAVEWDLLTSSGVADDTRKRQLRQLSQWAQAGNSFNFARDRNKVVNTTLSADAAAGASTVSVISATGITIGDEYIIRDATYAELIKVANVVSTTITLTEPLNFALDSGSRFRYAEYWPARLAPGANLIVERPPLHFGVQFDFIEDVNSL